MPHGGPGVPESQSTPRARDADNGSSHGQPAASQPCQQFQDAVAEYLIRHRSILDVLSKLQESSARVNRAVSKAVTGCGCIGIHATRQELPADISYADMKAHMQTHLEGELCEHCQEVVEMELGRTLFYLAATCELLGFDLDDVLQAERRRVLTLGVFNLT